MVDFNPSPLSPSRDIPVGRFRGGRFQFSSSKGGISAAHFANLLAQHGALEKSKLTYQGDATWLHEDGDGNAAVIDLNAAIADLSPQGISALMAALDYSLMSSDQLGDLVAAVTGDATALNALSTALEALLNAEDVAFDNSGTGLAATDVQAAIAELTLALGTVDQTPDSVPVSPSGTLSFGGTGDAPTGDIVVDQTAQAIADFVGQNPSDPATTALVDAIADDISAGDIAYDGSASGVAATSVQGGIDELKQQLDAVDQTPDAVPVSPNGTISFGGSGDAPTGDIVDRAVAQALADFVDNNPSDPAAQALVDAFGDDLQGADVHGALLAHYGSNTSDLGAMRALLDTDTDTRVVVSAVDTDADGTDNVLRFEVFAVDPVNGAPTGNALSVTDINLISFFDGLGAAGIDYDNSASGLSGNNIQLAIDELASDLAAVDQTPDTLPVSPNGTLNFGGTGDAPTGDIVANATANAIAAFIATNPNDPAAVALVNAVGGNLDGEDLHDALVAHYGANPADLAAMQALLDTNTDTRVVPSFVDTDSDGENDTLRFEVFAVDPASGNTTGSALATADIDLSSLVGNLDASDISFDNASSGSSATNVQDALDQLLAATQQAKLAAAKPFFDFEGAASTDSPAALMDGQTIANGAIDYPTTAAANPSLVVGNDLVTKDMRGLFLRGLDQAGAVDPDGAARGLGDTQGDTLKSHSHDINYGYGSNTMRHDGAQSGRVGTPAEAGVGASYGFTSPNAVIAAGDAETRPKNITVNYWLPLVA